MRIYFSYFYNHWLCSDCAMTTRSKRSFMIINIFQADLGRSASCWVCLFGSFALGDFVFGCWRAFWKPQPYPTLLHSGTIWYLLKLSQILWQFRWSLDQGLLWPQNWSGLVEASSQEKSYTPCRNPSSALCPGQRARVNYLSVKETSLLFSAFSQNSTLPNPIECQQKT